MENQYARETSTEVVSVIVVRMAFMKLGAHATKKERKGSRVRATTCVRPAQDRAKETFAAPSEMAPLILVAVNNAVNLVESALNVKLDMYSHIASNAQSIITKMATQATVF